MRYKIFKIFPAVLLGLIAIVLFLTQSTAQSEELDPLTWRVWATAGTLGGPAHQRTFRVGLYFGEEIKSYGSGNSKQNAELQAAEKLLETLDQELRKFLRPLA